MVTAFTLQKALRLRNVPFFFFFCSSGLGLRVLAFAVWVGFPPGWNGGFHLWRLPGESLSRGRTFFDRLILPDARALGAVLPGLSSYCLRHVQVACCYCCRSCSSHPPPSLFFLAKTSASRVLTVSSAPASERAITFEFLPARYCSSAPSSSNHVS